MGHGGGLVAWTMAATAEEDFGGFADVREVSWLDASKDRVSVFHPSLPIINLL